MSKCKHESCENCPAESHDACPILKTTPFRRNDGWACKMEMEGCAGCDGEDFETCEDFTCDTCGEEGFDSCTCAADAESWQQDMEANQ